MYYLESCGPIWQRLFALKNRGFVLVSFLCFVPVMANQLHAILV